MSQGYIAIHRKMLDNPIVCKDTDHMAVWMYLLLNATYTNYDVLFQGERKTLLPGQLLTGRKSIASQLKVSESKVQRILKLFENEQQIEQQTSNQNRLITILQWTSYQKNGQQDEQQMNNNRTTDEQQVNTNNNVNKVNKEKNEYGEFVSLTKVEYEKLTDKHGELLTRKMINVLDNYKGSSGKKYKSDYRAILSWVEKKVLEEKKKPRSGQRLGIPPAADNLGERIEGW